jgi:hypothetical protein
MNQLIKTAVVFLAVLVVYEVAIKRVVIKATYDDYEEDDEYEEE